MNINKPLMAFVQEWRGDWCCQRWHGITGNTRSPRTPLPPTWSIPRDASAGFCATEQGGPDWRSICRCWWTVSSACYGATSACRGSHARRRWQSSERRFRGQRRRSWWPHVSLASCSSCTIILFKKLWTSTSLLVFCLSVFVCFGVGVMVLSKEIYRHYIATAKYFIIALKKKY